MKLTRTFLFCLLSVGTRVSESFQSATTPPRVRNKHHHAALAERPEPAVSQETVFFTSSSVDMNQYNLPLEQISEQWSAQVQARNDFLDEGVYLGARNAKEFFADTVKLEIPRVPGQGLGMELLELAGGRGDGVGITVISGLLEGGCAENSGVMVGDSIVKVAVRKQSRISEDSLEEFEEIISVSTECMDYDNTVAAIGSLPPCESNDEMFILTVKRLRRKPKVKLLLQYPPEQGEENITLELFSGENLRRAMLVRGVKLNDPLSRRFDNGGSGDCGAEGTCATCAVSVIDGLDLLSPAGVSESQILKKNPRWRLACKAIVGYGMKEGELKVRVNPRQW